MAEVADSPAAVQAEGQDNVEFRAHSDMDGPLNIFREKNLIYKVPTFFKTRVYLSESFQKR